MFEQNWESIDVLCLKDNFKIKLSDLPKNFHFTE